MSQDFDPLGEISWACSEFVRKSLIRCPAVDGDLKRIRVQRKSIRTIQVVNFCKHYCCLPFIRLGGEAFPEAGGRIARPSERGTLARAEIEGARLALLLTGGV